jgi:hypothetical protein
VAAREKAQFLGIHFCASRFFFPPAPHETDFALCLKQNKTQSSSSSIPPSLSQGLPSTTFRSKSTVIDLNRQRLRLFNETLRLVHSRTHSPRLPLLSFPSLSLLSHDFFDISQRVLRFSPCPLRCLVALLSTSLLAATQADVRAQRCLLRKLRRKRRFFSAVLVTT